MRHKRLTSYETLQHKCDNSRQKVDDCLPPVPSDEQKAFEIACKRHAILNEFILHSWIVPQM
uniref:AlNc14C181G8213 protein n=1 Tax=Albugo laibachii Nc14 TaxID=890382 RepID=F0WP65_9STRA|nr:AlNc14C181G8213 [Albugo laibachii Nc14]|eukprot:CCA23111.1 AlNc14C181G8213 [Albugo laibachii Nc14]